MVLIVFSNAWGNQYGGINTFNYSLCEAIRKYIENESQRVGLIVVTSGVDDETKEKFSTSKSAMISLNDFSNTTSIVNLIVKAKNKLVLDDIDNSEVYCLGHDIYTGRVAIDCAKHEKIKAKSVVFHHMAYNQYYFTIANCEKTASDKVNQQRELLNSADIVIGIGPVLANSAKQIIDLHSSNTLVGQLIPGFDELEVGAINKDQFTVFFAGRIEYTDEENNNNIIKQYDSVIRAFCGLIKTGKLPANSKLILCGLSDENAKAHVDNVRKSITQQSVFIDSRSYVDREEMITSLRESDVAIVPSLVEGFGLTGLEAISAGVPLILSENSGLYRFLNSKNLVGLIKPIKVTGEVGTEESIQQCILDIKVSEEAWRSNARTLKDKLKDYSWYNVIERLIKFLNNSKYYKTTKEAFYDALKNTVLLDKGV